MKAKTYYFYVELEFGTPDNKYSKTYVIGQGMYKQPSRTKYYKTMLQWLDDIDNPVVSCGYTDDADDVCLQPYTQVSQEFIEELTTYVVHF